MKDYTNSITSNGGGEMQPLSIEQAEAIKELFRLEQASSKRLRWTPSEHKKAWKLLDALKLGNDSDIHDLLELSRNIK